MKSNNALLHHIRKLKRFSMVHETNIYLAQKTSATNDKQTYIFSTKTKLLNALKDDEEFELFVAYLSRECSTEIMFSFIEFTQYKQHLSMLYNKYHKNGNDNCSIRYSYELCESAPKSCVVYNHNYGDDCHIFKDKNKLIKHFKIVSYFLYLKYIEKETLLEINISAILRNKYFNMMNNFNVWINNTDIDINILINIFDESIEEMLYLQLQTFVRYVHSKC